jgi:hypothetical protein
MTTTLRDAVAQRAARLSEPPQRSTMFETPAGPLWSVTAIAERAEPREDLVTWQTWMLSTLAHTHRGRLELLGAAGPQWLHEQLMAYRDAAGIMGRAVHDALDARILEAPRPQPTEEQAPFVAAFERFEADHTPGWDAAAMTVAKIDGPGATWAGRADFFAIIDGRMVVGDFTTARRLEVAALKLVGLSMCDTGWVVLRDGTEVEPPEVAGAVIVHLRPDLYPDTGYRLVPVDITDWTMGAFEAAALMVHRYDQTGGLFTPPATGGA